MEDVLTHNPSYESRIRPYIGGQEVNSSPTQTPHRHVIYLSDVQDESQLDTWKELADIVREKVKPERDRLGSNPNNVPLRRRWWAYQAHRPTLHDALKDLHRVLANSQVGNRLTFAFLPSDWIYAHTLNLFLLPRFQDFALLQSRLHEIWARFFGSSMKDDLRYTPSDCFETFPFPKNWQADPTLEAAGEAYYDFRADLMVRNDEGLTKTYNRFHDPGERSPDILELRELHAAMDRAVLDAYGWTDIPVDCEFLLDYEIDEESWSPRRRKPYRYRWPEVVHDEVLARLLDLNQRRYQEEVLAGLHGESKPGKKAPGRPRVRKPRAPAANETLPLFGGPVDTQEDV